jgi:nicotinate-nucleotide adenylyltransferase
MGASKVVGVLGGSFDPPHVGHVLLGAYALAATELDELLVVPAFQHPLHKRARVGFEERFHMCELAFRDLRRVEVSSIERELGGPSRTVHTLEELLRREPDVQLRLILGADLLSETHRWYRWDRVQQLAPPVVVGRAGYDLPAQNAVQLPDVSSTDIRTRLARRERTRGLVPHGVEDYIFERGLYGGDT